jgi:hypothetical protein
MAAGLFALSLSLYNAFITSFGDKQGRIPFLPKAGSGPALFVSHSPEQKSPAGNI